MWWDAHNVPARHRYDRQKLTLKDVHNCQYVACMNPTSGSFTIDPRLQVSRNQPLPLAAPGRGSSGSGLGVLELRLLCPRNPLAFCCQEIERSRKGWRPDHPPHDPRRLPDIPGVVHMEARGS